MGSKISGGKKRGICGVGGGVEEGLRNILEMRKKVKDLEIKSRKECGRIMIGNHRSWFKREGLEFFGVKEYSFGDNIKNIDWNVTARMNEVYVKSYIEEKENEIWLVIDGSGSGYFGSEEETKKELMTFLGGLLGMVGFRQGNKVGLIIFGEGVEKYIVARGGKKHMDQIMRALVNDCEEGRGTNINGVCNFIDRVVKKNSIIFFISDLIDERMDKNQWIKLGRKYDLMIVRIKDKLEEGLPRFGLVEVGGIEGGGGMRKVVDLSQRKVWEQYQKKHEKEEWELRKRFKRGKIRDCTIKTGEDYVKRMREFLDGRKQNKI